MLSFEEFCEAEGRGDRRHELVGGRVYAMAGGSERHDLIAGLLYEAMARNARTAGCRAFLANRLLRTMAGNAYYPDLMVVCGAAFHRLYEQDPTLVVDVLSRSTEDVDRREKAQAYATCTSLRQYVLVDPDHRRIEVASPVGETLTWACSVREMSSTLGTASSTSTPSMTNSISRRRRSRLLERSQMVRLGFPWNRGGRACGTPLANSGVSRTPRPSRSASSRRCGTSVVGWRSAPIGSHPTSGASVSTLTNSDTRSAARGTPDDAQPRALTPLDTARVKAHSRIDGSICFTSQGGALGRAVGSRALCHPANACGRKLRDCLLTAV